MMLTGGYGYPGDVDCGSGAVCASDWKFQAGDWSELTAPVPGGQTTEFSAAYDSNASMVIGVALQLGSSGTDYGAYTYGFEFGTWVRIGYNNSVRFIPASTPGYYHEAIVSDPTAGGLLLYGGTNGTAARSETWAFADGSWTNVTNSSLSLPSPTAALSLAYDPVSRQVLLAQAGPTLESQSWVFDSAWSNATAPEQPPAFWCSSLAWDGIQSELLMFGGSPANGSGLGTNLTWEWGPHAALLVPQVATTPNPTEVGVPVNLTSHVAGGVPPYFYDWQFGDGGTSELPDSSHAYTSAGTAAGALWVNDSLGDSVFSEFSVSVRPSLTVSVSAAGSTVLVGGSFTVEATPNGGVPPYDFSYFGLPTGCSTADSPILTCSPSHANSYTISGMVRDALGASVTRTVNVTVSPAACACGPEFARPPLSPWILVGGIGVAAIGTAAVLLHRRRSRSPLSP